MLFQGLLGILSALPKPFALIRKPGATLFHSSLSHCQIQQIALARNPFAVHDVELNLTERRRDFVLRHFDLGAIPNDAIAIFDCADAADIKSQRRIKLERPPVVVSGLPNMTPIFSRIWLMKIKQVFDCATIAVSLRNACDIKRACNPGNESPISPSSSARGTSAATESITITSTPLERTSASAISSACSPESGCDISNWSMSTPSFPA